MSIDWAPDMIGWACMCSTILYLGYATVHMQDQSIGPPDHFFRKFWSSVDLTAGEAEQGGREKIAPQKIVQNVGMHCSCDSYNRSITASTF